MQRSTALASGLFRPAMVTEYQKKAVSTIRFRWRAYRLMSYAITGGLGVFGLLYWDFPGDSKGEHILQPVRARVVCVRARACAAVAAGRALCVCVSVGPPAGVQWPTHPRPCPTPQFRRWVFGTADELVLRYSRGSGGPPQGAPTGSGPSELR